MLYSSYEDQRKTQQKQWGDLSKAEKITGIVTLCVIAALIVLAASGIASAIKNQQEAIALEENRTYSIAVDGQEAADKPLDFECQLQTRSSDSAESRYQGELDTLQCSPITLQGTYSSYDTVKLTAAEQDGNLSVNSGTFTQEVNLSHSFSKQDWEKGSLSIATGVIATKTLKLSLTNEILKRTVANREVKVRYLLTQSDKKELESRQAAYKQRKAGDERKAKKDAARKAAAKARIADEKRAQESTDRQRQQVTRTQPAAPPKPRPRVAPKPTQRPNTSSLPLKAICKDGTISYQDTPSHPNYQGMCSSHRGIKTKLGRVP